MRKDKEAEINKEIFKAPRNTPGAEPGTLSWCYQTVFLLKLNWQDKILSERDWLKILGELKDYKVWEKIPPDDPYGSLDELLKVEVGVDEEEIGSEVQKYRGNPLKEKAGAPVGHKGSNEHSANDSETTISKQDRGKSYLLRRMARDFPEVLDQIETGEFKSTRQAAIHCGIIKVKTPLEELLTIAKKLDSEELITAKREFRRMGMSTTVTSGGVSINSGPLEATDRPSAIPKEKWRFLMREKRSFLNVQIKYLCKCLLDFIQDAEEMWEELGYTSRDDLIVNGYELDLSEVELATQWLKIKDPSAEY